MRFEDDSQVPFRPQYVRWAKGINPRDPAAVAAANSKRQNPNPAQTASKLEAAEKPATTPAPKQPRNFKRTWQDTSGKFSVEAEFIGLADGKVDLKKADGKVLSIPLDRLSETDQAAARAMVESLPNPFESNVQQGVIGSSSPTAVWQGVTEAEISFANLTPATYMRAAAYAAPWNVKADKVTPHFPRLSPKFVSFETEGVRSDDIYEYLFNEATETIWISQANRQWGLTRIQRVDLVQGRLLPMIEFAGYNHLLAVNPSGNLVLTNGDQNRINVWKVGTQGLTAIKSISLTGRNDQEWVAHFVDDNRALISTSRGSVLVSLLDYTASSSRPVNPLQFSPNRKHFLTWLNDQLIMVDSLSGKVLGTFAPGGKTQTTAAQDGCVYRIAFTPDGSQVAYASTDTLYFFDAQTGKELKALPIPNLPMFGLLSFSPQGYAVLSGEYAIEPVQGQVVAHVNVGTEMRVPYGGQQWYLKRSTANGKTTLTLEHCELPSAEMITRLAQSRIDDLQKVKPGSTLSLQTSPELPAAEQQQIRQAMAKKLEGTRLSVAPEGEMGDCVLTIEQVKQENLGVEITLRISSDKGASLWTFKCPIRPEETQLLTGEYFSLLLGKVMPRQLSDAIFQAQITPEGLKIE
ncbi:SHD1 domain-containing protein [Anatilimnocola floriformis]|uniref:SHD1 domain-containing protein n=1 Tax=Anatilimnocola floriformis TaxID=2948575 RepID=UPI0020C3AB83|nr:SHD1 domain-containing protein [Anatilimnocola floriformis]